MIAKLASSWVVAQISEISEINPRLDKSKIAGNLEVSFVPMHAVGAESGKIDVSAKRLFSEVEKGYTAFKQGDVLFAKITPCMENGKMAIVPEVHGGLGFGSTEFHVLRSANGINPKYIYHFVSSKRFRSDAAHNMTGAVGQRRVPTTYLSQVEIPLPPFAEQGRIVAKIEELFSELDQGIENLKLAQAKLKVYRQALLKHAFEGKLTAAWRAKNRNEGDTAKQYLAQLAASKNKVADFVSDSIHPIDSWAFATLDELTDYITSGSRGWAEFYAESGSLFIRAQNLNSDKLDLTDIAYVKLPPKAEGKRTQTRSGDVLITITGANVTKAGYQAKDLGEAYVSQHVALCRPLDTTLSEYLHLYIISNGGGRKDLERAAYGAGKPGLNLDNVRSLEIPVPPPAEVPILVAEIRSVLVAIDSLESDIETNLQKAEVLRQSILKKAFAGELVPQDPTDEPAAELLKRIADQRTEQERAAKQAKAVRRKVPAHRKSAKSKQ